MRDSGELQLIGITEEQHPDRCQLYAQWQGFDWPILWDPFNLTRSKAVPLILGVDPHGMVRADRMHPARMDKEAFFAEDYAGALQQPVQDFPITRALLATPLATDPLDPAARAGALAAFLWNARDRWDAALEILSARAAQPTASGSDHFEFGVALRLRYDADVGEAADLQGSLDAWMHALAIDPSQYIWRRRIQQYGPRLDKPYPFYDWVQQALEELAARGAEATVIRVPLSGSEIAGKSNELPRRLQEQSPPDPRNKIPVDVRKLITIEGAAALHTGAGSRRSARPVARVHLALRPDGKRAVHWGDEAGPTVLWISVPRDWMIARNGYELATPEDSSAANGIETRRLDFEVMPPEGSTEGGKVRGYALYNVCVGESGECVYLRQDFEVRIPAIR